MIAPSYSKACRRDVDRLLAKGGSLSAYRSNPDYPIGPALGSWAWKLECRAEQMFGIDHAVACQSGTTALWAAIAAAGFPPGEIITTAFTFSATPASIRWAGHAPVFADVDELTHCLDPLSVKRMMSPRTVALMPVDLFGGLADYSQLASLGVPIIEDACQAVGARRDGTWAGNFGLAGAYSFNGAKNVPAGEAGMLVTRDADLARRARLLISHGESFQDAAIGFNGRVNELTACVAWHGLKDVVKMNQRRARLAATVHKIAARVGATVPVPGPVTDTHALYVCPVHATDPAHRKRVALEFTRLGFQVQPGYIRPPLHRYPAFRACRRDGELPMTQWLADQGLLLVTQAPEDTI